MSAKLTKKEGNRITQFGFNPVADQTAVYVYGFAWKGEFQDAATKKITTANPKVIESMKWLADFSKNIGVDALDAFVAALRARTVTMPTTTSGPASRPW